MVDYVDWEGWVSESLFDAEIKLRRTDWLEDHAAREALKAALRAVAQHADTLDKYAPAPRPWTPPGT